MSNPLAVYLSDHLAGARAAIDLLEFVRDQHEGEPMSEFATDMLVEIKADRDVLNDLVRLFEAKRAAAAKEALALVGEKATHVMMRRHANRGLGTFLALESLALGILGKLALWRALAEIAASDPRLSSVDYDRLITRAKAQHEEAEEHRLRYARTILGS